MRNCKLRLDQPCVYCGSMVPSTMREHVIPQALGTFEQNWTIDCVCDECNHFFSRELELALGRDSAEAFFRVDFGVKPAAAADKFLNRRMRATLKAPGLFMGAHVVMKPTVQKDDMLPALPAQVGFKRIGEDWRYVLERNLNEESIKDMAAGTFEIKVIGRGDDLPRLARRLAVLGLLRLTDFWIKRFQMASRSPSSMNSLWIRQCDAQPPRSRSTMLRRSLALKQYAVQISMSRGDLLGLVKSRILSSLHSESRCWLVPRPRKRRLTSAVLDG
jgi:HNH endonuclease